MARRCQRISDQWSDILTRVYSSSMSIISPYGLELNIAQTPSNAGLMKSCLKTFYFYNAIFLHMNRTWIEWDLSVMVPSLLITPHETCLQDFIVILRHPLENYNNILKTCFLGHFMISSFLWRAKARKGNLIYKVSLFNIPNYYLILWYITCRITYRITFCITYCITYCITC